MLSTILLVGLGSFVVILLVAVFMTPSKSGSNQPIAAYAAPLQPLAPTPVKSDPDDSRWRAAMAEWERKSQLSLRDREIEEDAAALAGEFRRVKQERYLASLRSDAAEYFATPTAAAKKTAS